MNRRMDMHNVREVLRLVNEGKLSTRQIARSCQCSPTTVAAIAERYQSQHLDWPMISQMDDAELEAKLYPQEVNSSKKPLPDYEYIHKELMRKGVTLQLLWQEYKDKYPEGVQYTQFCDHYLKWRKLRNLSMHQIHRAGEKVFVDWAGLTHYIIDADTGERREVYFFVAALGASDLLYTEPFLSMELPAWINAHVNAFAYFGGTPEIIVPDNTKTAVKKPSYYEPEIHPTYREMAAHYGCVVIPARVRKPKDKAPAENGVQLVERWIIARIRNQTFFSLHDLKQSVKSLLEEANNKPFQKREGSRKSLFHEVEEAALKPLPVQPYQYALWKKAKVNIDYCVEFEGNYYSVPYQLVKQPVEIRATYHTVEIIHKGKRISSFPRQQANKHIWKIEPSHMPPNHQKVSEWTPERIVKWASTVGPYTASLVTRIMASKEHAELGFRSCMGIIRLSKVYSSQRVENASKRALAYGAISYHSMVSILEKGLDHLAVEEETEISPIMHENLRGIEYFSRGVN